MPDCPLCHDSHDGPYDLCPDCSDDMLSSHAPVEHGGWDDEGYFIDNGPCDSDPYDTDGPCW